MRISLRLHALISRFECGKVGARNLRVRVMFNFLFIERLNVDDYLRTLKAHIGK